MTTIISLVNQKGGVGKTTSAVNLSACLAEEGQRVLLMDMDPQGNTSQVYTQVSDTDKSMYQLLVSKPISGSLDFSDFKKNTYIDNLDVIPSNVLLSSAEIDLISEPARETILKRVFKSYKSDFDAYDTIIIDCPPSLGLLTVNSIIASDYVLVPLHADVFSLTGLELLLETVEKLQAVFEINTSILGFFFTQVHPQEALFKEAFDLCKGTYKDKLLTSFIRTNTAINHAHATDQSVLHFAPNSKASEDYKSLTNEVKTRLSIQNVLTC